MKPDDTAAAEPGRVVAVVGAGPSGLYCVSTMLDADPQLRVHVIDRLPTPFGLVRNGVAPDHGHIKNVTRVLRRPFDDGRARFLGNVTVGVDVSHAQLVAGYDAVVYAFGAEEDNPLAIPGSELCATAGSFVRWYNGHPDAAEPDFELDCPAVAVIGGGNVALDIARILGRTAEEMRATDVPEHIVGALARKRVRDVHLLVRGRPEQARFTPVELAQLGELDDAAVSVHLGPNGLTDPDQQSDRRVRQNLEVLHGFVASRTPDRGCTIHLHFEASPVEARGANRVEELTVKDPEGNVSYLPVGLVIPAIGFRSRPLPGLPFDHLRGLVPNLSGRVLEDNDRVVPGLYVAGWLKRGPSGVIGTNKADGAETARSVLEDLAKKREFLTRKDPLAPLVSASRIVGWQEWLRLEQHEEGLGLTTGRGRVKVHDRETMLRIC